MNKLSMCKLFIAAPNTYRGAIITDHCIRILELITLSEYEMVDSRWLSELSGKSIQNSSAVLVSLWKKGYLSRVERIDTSGGIIYKYQRTFG